MGCDIHLHVEAKIHGEWQHWREPRVARCYALFAMMADVRNDADEYRPISQPRGLPNDASDITKADYNSWSGDAHSASWLDSVEVAELCHRAEAVGLVQQSCDPYPPRFARSRFGDGDYATAGIGGDCACWPDEIEDFRFVFWFDN